MKDRLKKFHNHTTFLTYYGREDQKQELFWAQETNQFPTPDIELPTITNEELEAQLSPYWIDYLGSIYDHFLGEHTARIIHFFNSLYCSRFGHSIGANVSYPESGGEYLSCQRCGWGKQIWHG